MKKNLNLLFVFLMLVTTVVAVSAQGVTYDKPWFTSYQVANLGNGEADIVVDYYDATGNVSAGAQRTFSDVPIGGSVTVLQATEDTLGTGVWSAVISSDQPVAAVANQQLGVQGSTSSYPPFSSYSGASEGATTIVLPTLMYNWFGYYTEVFIQNVGDADATNVDITYYPTKVGACTVGAAGQSDDDMSVPQFASQMVSQLDKSALGAPTASGCDAFTGRFLGSAVITADQPVIVVVNQHVQGKLFTYNGFGSGGGTETILPAYMKNYYGYYASVTIANPSSSETAYVTMTYQSDSSFSNPTDTTVVATHSIPPLESINRYDGSSATADQTDLEGDFGGDSNRFFGSVVIDSNIPVVAMVNQESAWSSGSQAGSYNGLIANFGSQKISVPLIQSDFYGYYTSLTIMTVDGSEATVNITYTSDGTYSSVTNHSETYQYTTSNGFLNRYEGSSATAAQSDLLDDAAWVSGTGDRRFIGSAVIEVVSGADIVAFVNSESSVSGSDSMYTYNAFNQ